MQAPRRRKVQEKKGRRDKKQERESVMQKERNAYKMQLLRNQSLCMEIIIN
jgi:hypothetical protein